MSGFTWKTRELVMAPLQPVWNGFLHSSRTKGLGVMHPSITEKRIVSAVKRDDGTGFCITCGKAQRFVEPDAERYLCVYPRCASHQEFTVGHEEKIANHGSVYGAEQLLLMTVR